MKFHQKTIVIDFDSTIFPFYDAVRDAVKNGIITKSEAKSYPDLDKCGYTGTVREWDDLTEFCGGLDLALGLWAKVGSYRSMRHYKPFDGSVEIIERWKVEGAKIVLLSDRAPENSGCVQRWCEEHRIPIDEYYVGRYPDKLKVMHELGAVAIVDDKPATLEACHQAGLIATGLRWHYNREMTSAYGIHMGNVWAGIDQIIRKKFAHMARLEALVA